MIVKLYDVLKRLYTLLMCVTITIENERISNDT